METKLRVKQVQPSRRIHPGCSAAGRCNECSDKIWLEIKLMSTPRNEHGLRVIDRGKHPLAADHPWRLKGYSQLAALGNSRDERN